MSVQTNKQSLLFTAYEVLLRNLGLQKTNQLWQILTPFKGGYVSERKKTFRGKSVDSIYKEAKKFNKK